VLITLNESCSYIDTQGYAEGVLEGMLRRHAEGFRVSGNKCCCICKYRALGGL